MVMEHTEEAQIPRVISVARRSRLPWRRLRRRRAQSQRLGLLRPMQSNSGAGGRARSGSL